jgi:hypothetical protein
MVEGGAPCPGGTARGLAQEQGRRSRGGARRGQGGALG